MLPSPRTPTGVAALVCPGGGYFNLTWDYEGLEVATSPSDPRHRRVRTQVPRAPDGRDRPSAFLDVLMQVGSPEGLRETIRRMDEFAAIAEDWGVDVCRLGALGFSAGARLVLDLATSTDDRAAFARVVYGPVTPNPVPLDAPPLFIAVSADDLLFTDCVDTDRAGGAPAGVSRVISTSGAVTGWGMTQSGIPRTAGSIPITRGSSTSHRLEPRLLEIMFP